MVTVMSTSYDKSLASLFKSLLVSLPLSGVRLPRHPADHLSCGHHLPVRFTHNPQHLPSVHDRVAPLLRPLAARHGGLPLLQGHHNSSRKPTQGTRPDLCYQCIDICLCWCYTWSCCDASHTSDLIWPLKYYRIVYCNTVQLKGF